MNITHYFSFKWCFTIKLVSSFAIWDKSHQLSTNLNEHSKHLYLALLYIFNQHIRHCHNDCTILAPSSEFVSSSIPSWQISTAHAQTFRGARDLAFCLKVPLDSLLVWASSEGSGETARMRRLAWTFAARIDDKYQIRLARPICWVSYVYIFVSVFLYNDLLWILSVPSKQIDLYTLTWTNLEWNSEINLSCEKVVFCLLFH